MAGGLLIVKRIDGQTRKVDNQLLRGQAASSAWKALVDAIAPGTVLITCPSLEVRIPGCYVTRFAPHKAIKSIARGNLTFYERVVIHRADIYIYIVKY